jgi:hypothetical protein
VDDRRGARRPETRVTAAAHPLAAVPDRAEADGPARYRLFGLIAETDRSLPGLPPDPDAGAPDVRIWLGRVPAEVFPPVAEEPWYLSPRQTAEEEPTVEVWRRADGGFRLRYADGCEYHVDAGASAVACTWPAHFTPEDAATYLLGPIFGLLLRLRGIPALHASAVAIGGRALALCGPPRAGKSTTAAALAARGHPLVADDVLALPILGEGIQAQPAYPHLRLWPDVVAPLFGPGAELPLLTPNWDKRLLRLDAAFHRDPLPLGAVYLLAAREEGADAPRLEPLAGAGTVLALTANAYVGWFPGREAQARELAVLGRVARAVPIVRAVPHADPARLGDLCALLEADFRERTGGGGDG